MWTIKRTDKRATLVFSNPVTGVTFACGETPLEYDDSSFLYWIFENGKPCFGDLIKMSDGKVFSFHDPGAKA